MDPAVDKVSAAETHALRHAVLRPHEAIGAMAFAGDDHADAGHFAARLDGGIVGVVSVTPEPRANDDAPGQWRLRGMATAAGHRGSGVGSKLVAAVIEHCRGRGGRVVWCNARTTAAGFYERHGFRRVGGEFELPDIGPHVVMTREL